MSSSSCLEMPSVGERGNRSPAQRLMDEWNRLEQPAERTQWKNKNKKGYMECIGFDIW